MQFQVLFLQLKSFFKIFALKVKQIFYQIYRLNPLLFLQFFSLQDSLLANLLFGQ
jgi:hypothetical protein